MNTVVGYPATRKTGNSGGMDIGRKTAGDHVRGAGRGTQSAAGLKKVFICSPFRPQGKTEEEREKGIRDNIHLAQYACRYAVMAGYVPYAPHLYFPQILDDDDCTEREVGITLGLSWLARCDELWVIGYHISEGMNKEIRKAREWGIPIKFYCLPRHPEKRLMDEICAPAIHYNEMKMEEI